MLQNEDSTFDDIVAALTGYNAMTFASTSEALFAPVEEAVRTKPRVVNDKLKRWTKRKLPKRMLMQRRELVTVLSERVAVNIVGPFPVAQGGFKYLSTYLDMATRWPEAIPLSKTTTATVIQQLTQIFARNGFPTTLVSDNGPQFIAESFKKFLKEKDIEHVKASPYHPQGNGVPQNHE